MSGTGPTVYDENVRLYIEFVDRVLDAEPSLFRILLDHMMSLIGARLPGARICDIACGEGYVSRELRMQGAAHVVGIDLSTALIEEATLRADQAAMDGVAFAVDDAHELKTLEDASFDIAVSQMAMMDIPDHRAAFAAIRRVLRPGGVFVFSFLHPCFEAPYRLPDEPQFLLDDEGAPTAVAVRRYGTEGHWQSEGAGLRGHVGSYHRMLSTYLNDLIGEGFSLERIEEPLAPGDGLVSQVPRVIVVAAVAGEQTPDR